MHAPFNLSANSLFVNSAAGRLLLALKTWLAPAIEVEPGCSKQYAALYRQAQWATRLFWLASVVVVSGTVLLAVAQALR